ncbi:Protein cycle [Gryllus bimaculatus]|nr:Protein cycle [Gryllus bimaculatus]
MSNLIKRGSTRRSDDTMDEDGDDKDDTKRKSRNLSEKKRRDQFNMLINELSSMVSTNSRKMDKSTVLKSTISFLKNHNEIAVRSRAHEIQEDWKPSFLSNEEFTHLILEALDGFIMVFSSSGRIFYASESITSLLGHLPSDLMNMTIYDMVYEEDQSSLYNVFLNPSNCVDGAQYDDSKENQVSFSCHLKRGGLDFREEVTYELVQFVGYFRTDVDPLEVDNLISSSSRYSNVSGEPDTRLVFVGTGRLQTPLLIREMSVVDSTKSEFTSRHSLEWKFLFLDHRAPPIIGYLPFEVLGTSGYDYYHVDDLEKRSRASVHGVQVLGKPLLTMATPQQVTPSTATFLEPQQQYVAAIPVQPVLAAGFPGTAAVVTTLPAPELMRQPIVMTTAQSQIQEQLQRKHEELQQLIVQQQEELRRVSEQLLMARYGLLPPVQLNVTLPYSTGTVSSTTNPIVQEGVVSSDMPVPVSSDLFVGSHPPLVRQHPQATSIMVEPHQVNRQNHSTEDVLPFQLSQQQAQLLFSSNSTQHHQ